MSPTPISSPRTSGLPRREFLQVLGAGALGLALTGRGAAAETTPRLPEVPPFDLKPGPKKLRGLFPIGQTPFTEADKLDLESLAAQVPFCNRGGVHGFIWPQIASDWTMLTEPERMAGAEAIIAAGKGGSTTLVIGVQGPDMATVTRYAQHAAKTGADALVSLPPAGVTDEKVLLDYYQQVGRLTELPLFVQTQGSMSVDLVVELFKTVPTIRQVKDEAGVPLERITELRRRTGDQLRVFSGQGVRTMINEMELGFVGHCPYTGLADVYAAAYDLWHAGKKREAFDMFGRVLAFGSLGTADWSNVLAARGVFKPNFKSRKAAGAGGGGGGGGRGAAGPRLDDQGIRNGLNYLKPYLKA
ncbi:MAG TPA: dihydrodipicolinate synthase family protein [Opitutaceae bacterium]|nr:dihydrodipicolinate synthase family protein [Opitutaceae bacterium]